MECKILKRIEFARIFEVVCEMNLRSTKEPRTKAADMKMNKEIPEAEMFRSTRKSLTKPITESTLKKKTVAAKITKKKEIHEKS